MEFKDIKKIYLICVIVLFILVVISIPLTDASGDTIAQFGIIVFFTMSSGFLTVRIVGHRIWALSWPKTDGRVIDAKVEETEEHDGFYLAKIRYRYSVDTEEFVNDRYNYHNSGETKPWAERIVKKYKPDQSVVVYYNPYDPKKALLKRGLTVMDILVSLLLFLVFIALFYFMITIIQVEFLS